ncbi:bifunctional heptose 7-phosphate kinase/heptose 1-phosphate adenyltransferase [Thermosulfurimonas sp. F29]|uniref:bifunctional heptose 7-phosphate kinase/heptose 1-phosphate adenyltransferase n=1 Tax=Thermosulfurimonas sp. F29 TaxID=2867247 RepID=UPI001C82E99E|nr:PfkB family carbohydrate kinase [Thermosulfurimonas sp. F29]MBX6423750.1 D-glycero-beta-D-manno-heptose-7-phosphate kinase [Thermosulfurimonas sp. F29]
MEPAQLKESLSSLTILVVGDVMLDQYFWGEVRRISPEAPVPVFELKEISHALGGAANVAANLCGLGVRVELCGLLGKDREGEVFRRLAGEIGLGISALVEDPERPTTVKTRVIAQAQHLLRIDTEKTVAPGPEVRDLLKERLETLFSKVQAVILSDYAKGMFSSPGFSSWVVEEARRRRLPVFVDPKGLRWEKYTGATCITPNRKEFNEILRVLGLPEGDLVRGTQELVRRYELSFMVVTLGSEGMFLHHPGEGNWHFPARAKEVYDVSGAGDTAIAALTAFYTVGLPLKEVVAYANLCAGIVVGKMGTKPVLWEEFEKALKGGQDG